MKLLKIPDISEEIIIEEYSTIDLETCSELSKNWLPITVKFSNMNKDSLCEMLEGKKTIGIEEAEKHEIYLIKPMSINIEEENGSTILIVEPKEAMFIYNYSKPINL